MQFIRDKGFLGMIIPKEYGDSILRQVVMVKLFVK